MDFRIIKGDTVNDEQHYTVQYFTNVNDLDGNSIQIVDESRTEDITIQQLNNALTDLDIAMEIVNQKLNIISKLK